MKRIILKSTGHFFKLHTPIASPMPSYSAVKLFQAFTKVKKPHKNKEKKNPSKDHVSLTEGLSLQTFSFESKLEKTDRLR